MDLELGTYRVTIYLSFTKDPADTRVILEYMNIGSFLIGCQWFATAGDAHRWARERGLRCFAIEKVEA